MNKLIFTTLLLSIPISKSQIININLCSDNSCNAECVSWTTISGKCSPCDDKRLPCSNINPSTIVTSSSITFYSDYNCNNLIPNLNNIPIILDYNCHQLYTYGNMTISRSYNAIDVSMVIGIVSGVIILLILCCVINCYRFRRCCFRRYTPPPPRNIVVLDYQENTLSDYRFNLYPAVKIYPSTPYYPQPSAPPAYPIPSAPSSYPIPSAPPANLP